MKFLLVPARKQTDCVVLTKVSNHPREEKGFPFQVRTRKTFFGYYMYIAQRAELNHSSNQIRLRFRPGKTKLQFV